MKTKLLLLALALDILNLMSVSCDQLKNDIKENTRKYCYGDLCNVTYQYCSETYQRCHLCTDMLSYCSTSELPQNCMNTCIDFFVKQKLESEKGKPCTRMQDLKHGFQNASTEQTIKPGTVVLFSCHTGYRLVGEKFITCSAYGQWSGSMPRCEEITCKSPPPIADGFWSNKGEYVAYSFGNTVTAFCDDTFNMDGAYIWNCSTDGWVTYGLKYTFPRCLKQDRSSNFSFVYPGVIAVLLFLLLLTIALSHRRKLKRWCCCLKRSKASKKEKPEILLDMFVEKDEAYGSKYSNASRQTNKSSIVNENPCLKSFLNEQGNIGRDGEQTRPSTPDGITVVNNITVQSGNMTGNAPQMNGKGNAVDNDKTPRSRDTQTESTGRRGIKEKTPIEESSTSVLKQPSETDRLLPEPDEQSNCKSACTEPLLPRDAQNPETDGQGAHYNTADNTSDIHCDDNNERNLLRNGAHESTDDHDGSYKMAVDSTTINSEDITRNV